MRLVRGIRAVSKAINAIGMVVLAILMLLGAADVLGRYLFNQPIMRTYEISQILLASIVFFGWAYTQYEDKHISIGLVFERFSPSVQRIIRIITHFLALIVFGLIAWQATILAMDFFHANRLLGGLLIPIYPFQLFVSFGAVLICLELIIQIFFLLIAAPDMAQLRKGEEVQY